MKGKKILGLGLVFALLLGLVAIGCGDDDSSAQGGTGGSAATGGTGGTAGSGGAGGTAGADAATGGDAEAVPDATTGTTGNNTMTGILKDPNTSGEPVVPGVTIEALNNDTGAKLNISAVTGDDGTFTLKGLPDGLIGVKAVGGKDGNDVDRIDSYTFNIKSNEQDRAVYSVLLTITQIVEGTFTTPFEKDKAAVSGAVYWVNTKTGEAKPLACATVELEGATGDVYYFTPAKVPDSSGTLKETQLDGRFFLANVTPPKVTVVAKLKGEKIGSATMPLFAANTAETAEKYNINITRILYMTDADPTPSGCTAK